MPEFSEESLRKIAKQKVQKKLFVEIHAAAYIGVNALLLVINLLTLPTYLWVPWPVCGWGVGLGMHIASYLIWLTGLTGGKVGFTYHLSAFILGNLFLVFVWWMTSCLYVGDCGGVSSCNHIGSCWSVSGWGGFWFLYPLIAWLVGLIIHWIVVRPKTASGKGWMDTKVDQEMEKLSQKGALPPREE